MNAHNGRNSVKGFVPMCLTMLTVALVCISAADARAGDVTYTFPTNSQGWRHMGLYDGGGLNPLPDFATVKNPWTNIDGDGGAIAFGWEQFVAASPTGESWIHGDLNSPDLQLGAARTFGFGVSFDITGSHMASTGSVQVQAVIVVRKPNEISDRRYAGEFHEVSLGEDGAWDTHTFSLLNLPAGTIIKKINLRIFFATADLYSGWVMVDNVILRVVENFGR